MGGTELALDLQHWVNDGLMTFFFFAVGLEVKRELVLGELADRRRAAVPALAALAGLVVPALVYAVFNLGEEAVSAWGVVISTDTAFLIGVLALLGSAVPPQLRVFLMALAIADDVGALSVIALFYTENRPDRQPRRDLRRIGGATRVGNFSEPVWGDSAERRQQGQGEPRLEWWHPF